MIPMIYLSSLDTQEDRSKFEEIYQKYRSKMYGIAYSILGNNEDSEDAVHNAFVKLADEFTNISHLSCNEITSYIVIIIRNAAIDIYRRNKRDREFKEPIEAIKDETDIDFSDIIITKEMMLSAVKQLPEKYKDVLFLYYYEQRSSKETAQLLGISESDVRVAAYRAKAMLRKILKGDDRNG